MKRERSLSALPKGIANDFNKATLFCNAREPANISALQCKDVRLCKSQGVTMFSKTFVPKFNEDYNFTLHALAWTLTQCLQLSLEIILKVSDIAVHQAALALHVELKFFSISN
jgi:hypothetical protein